MFSLLRSGSLIITLSLIVLFSFACGSSVIEQDELSARRLDSARSIAQEVSDSYGGTFFIASGGFQLGSTGSYVVYHNAPDGIIQRVEEMRYAKIDEESQEEVPQYVLTYLVLMKDPSIDVTQSIVEEAYEVAGLLLHKSVQNLTEELQNNVGFVRILISFNINNRDSAPLTVFAESEDLLRENKLDTNSFSRFAQIRATTGGTLFNVIELPR